LDQVLPVPDTTLQKTIVEYLDALELGNVDSNESIFPQVWPSSNASSPASRRWHASGGSAGLRREAAEEAEALIPAFQPMPMMKQQKLLVVLNILIHFAAQLPMGHTLLRPMSPMEFPFCRKGYYDRRNKI